MKISHIIHSVTFGGAARTMVAVAKYARALHGYQDTVIPLCLEETDPNAVQWTRSEGMEVLLTQSQAEIMDCLRSSDIVIVHWWNNPYISEFFRWDLPSMRMVGWFHVAGDKDPQAVTDKVVDYLDFAIAGSPHTYQCSAIQSLPTEIRLNKTGIVYDAADFARVRGAVKRPHTGFNVGYIGTVDFIKMHRQYVRMSAKARVPDVKFIVCGGGIEELLKEEAQAFGASDRFDFRGYIQDIKCAIEIFDVYGYPLCEDTYAAAELNLQEVMHVGIPPVVFPYGGVKLLVINDFTGIVVNSEQEYTEAIEYLYQSPAERERLGINAKEYATQIFGAENAALKLDRVLQKVITWPKRYRIWGVDRTERLSSQTIKVSDVQGVIASTTPAKSFLESLTDNGQETFRLSLAGEDDAQIIKSESKLSNSSNLMRDGGVVPYKRRYPEDPYLRLWSGLMLLGAGRAKDALVDLAEAYNKGCNHWRVLWYLAIAARKAGEHRLEESLLTRIKETAPHSERIFDGITLVS